MRTVQGVGSAATQTGCYSLLAAETHVEVEKEPEKAEAVAVQRDAHVSARSEAGGGFGGMEMVGGVGYMAAPLLAGVLFDSFGYSVPPITIACLGVVCFLAVLVLLPSEETIISEVDASFILRHTHDLSASPCTLSTSGSFRSSRSLSSLPIPVRAFVGTGAHSDGSAASSPDCALVDVLRIPRVLYCCLVCVVSIACMSFLGATLERQLHAQWGLSNTQVGACFALSSLTNLLMCPVVGWLSDRLPERPIMLVGLALTGACLAFLGPPSGLEGELTHLWVQLVSLGVMGCGVALAFIPTFAGKLRGSAHLGLSAQAVVAGISASVCSLGEVVGPLIGSAVVGLDGFSRACQMWALVCLCAVLVGLVMSVVECALDRRRATRYSALDEPREPDFSERTSDVIRVRDEKDAEYDSDGRDELIVPMDLDDTETDSSSSSLDSPAIVVVLHRSSVDT